MIRHPRHQPTRGTETPYVYVQLQDRLGLARPPGVLRVHAGDAVADRRPDRRRQRRPARRRIRLRAHRLDELHGVLAQDARRLARGVTVDHPGRRVGRRRRPHARQRERHGVGHGDMAAVPAQDNGVVRRRLVEVPAARVAVLGEALVVPAAARQPLPGRRAAGPLAHGADEIGDGAAGTVDLGEEEPVGEQVEVAVGQGRQQHGPTEVDPPGGGRVSRRARTPAPPRRSSIGAPARRP